MNKTAVIILNYNGAEMLRRFLPGVTAYSPDATVYVADNASTDSSCEVVRSEFPTVRLIQLEENYGFAEGYNRAIAKVDEEYVMLLNSDVQVSPNWLTPLEDMLDHHPDVAACQPKILSYRHMSRFEYAGAAGGYMDRWGYTFCRGRIFSAVETDRGQYDTPVPVFWATGAALMIRRSDYVNAGGLDARFFAHMEEVDLCWRLGCRGRRLMCVPQSYVFHVGGATLSKANPQKTYLNFRNNLLMIYKNAPAARLHGMLRFRALADTAAALMFLLTGHTRDAAAVMRARRDFRRMRRTFLPEREVNMRLSVTLTPPCVYRRSILYSYYIRGRHHFSQLKMPSL